MPSEWRIHRFFFANLLIQERVFFTKNNQITESELIESNVEIHNLSEQ